MKTFGIIGCFLLIIGCFSLSVSALSIRGDVLWNDQPLSFLLIAEDSRYVLKIENQQDQLLRVLADMEAEELFIIDDMMEEYASVQSKQLISIVSLLALGKVIGVEESWLQGEQVNFYQTGEKKEYDPFGECLQLRVNDTITGMYWSFQLDNLFLPIITPMLEKLIHDGIHFPFWESVVKMKGFIVVNQKDQKTIYRLIEVGDVPLEWQKEAQHGDYEQKEWMDFLSPFKGGN
ncbi:hypothetical protein [Atribacter laminatus]|uniref:Uncharacterized protein n=1 Tax=Atribacter laminatus TaxID=2847778 RepID=A0A7T1F3D7_ATRLM|nr:hypothetical protein [Atribacter laminatus]QPM68320.1 hypothetical protein RT761_01538 [Atribacter laminatus]